MPVPDLLAALADHPDLNVPEGFQDSMLSEYNTDLEGSASSSMAKIAQIEEERDAALALVQELKVQNFDLLMATAADPTGSEDGLPNPAESDADTPDSGIASLFEEVDSDGNPTTKED